MRYREKGLETKLQMGMTSQDTTVCRPKGAEKGGVGTKEALFALGKRIRDKAADGDDTTGLNCL